MFYKQYILLIHITNKWTPKILTDYKSFRLVIILYLNDIIIYQYCVSKEIGHYSNSITKQHCKKFYDGLLRIRNKLKFVF